MVMASACVGAETLSRLALFRDTLPAWSDANLRSISEQIRSQLFFAHVRASTGTTIKAIGTI
jgi:predicted glutamine amidotransferase